MLCVPVFVCLPVLSPLCFPWCVGFVTSGGGFTDQQAIRFVSIYVSGNKSLVASALGSQSSGRKLAVASAKQARAIVYHVFEHLGIVDKWAAIDDFMTKFKGNPSSSMTMSKYIQTLTRRDRKLGRVSTTPHRLHPLSLGCPTDLLALPLS